MFDHFAWATIILALTLLTVSPGVDTLLVLRNASKGGHIDGWLTAFGICMGLFVHASISAAGLSAILLGSATLFAALKLAGASYLIWLGIESLRAARRSEFNVPDAPRTSRSVPAWTSFREGLLSNVLNPKPIIFYMAFMPQFIDPEHSAALQSLFIAGLHFMIAMIFLGTLASAIEVARSWLQRPRVRSTIDGTTGALLLGFGAHLLLTSADADQ